MSSLPRSRLETVVTNGGGSVAECDPLRAEPRAELSRAGLCSVRQDNELSMELGENSTILVNDSIALNKTERSCDGLRACFFTRLDDYTVGAAFTLLTVLGLVLNPLTIGIVASGRRLSSAVKPHLINLAVSDFLVSIFTPPLILIMLLKIPIQWTSISCKLLTFFHLGLVHVSLMCNTVISLERFFIIYFPLKATLYRQKHRGCFILLAWLAGLVPEIPIALSAHVGMQEGLPYCHTAPKPYTPAHDLQVTMKFLIPSFIIVICYTAIVAKLAVRKQSKLHRNASKQMNKQLGKLQRMLMADAFLTVLTWLPLSVAVWLYNYSPKIFQGFVKRDMFRLLIIIHFIASTNACSSPVVYFLFNKHFRADSKSFICRILKIKEATTSPTTARPTLKITEQRNKESSLQNKTTLRKENLDEENQ
ncbi:blue-sensitive opsin-like [Watersipora subatra]|uniref:blue-sensitive opsin-like n=1 Tax=Watersipora subatra TaxID=2589382 RepID=UPI00355C703F